MTLRDFGRAIVARLPVAYGLARRFYSLMPQYLHDTPTSRARAFFAGEQDVTLMQIGAYDGVAGDPVRPLLLANPTWQGVLIEPQPEVFARLEQNYRGRASTLRLLNAAISSERGQLPFFSIAVDEIQRRGLPPWSAEVASFNADHLRLHFPDVEIECRPLTAMTFGDAANLLPDGRVDLVAMDVEGHESVILPAIDFDRHRVRFLIFEHKHIAADALAGIVALLERHGFELKAFGRDTIAWRGLIATSPAVDEKASR